MCVAHKKLFGKPASGEAKKTAVVKPIPKRSEKMKETIKALKKKYADFLSMPQNKYCKIKEQGCTKVATVVHHSNGREGNILNATDWMPSCANCNIIIEQNHLKATHDGNKKQRHTKENLRGKVRRISEVGHY
jgi:hypothetical protein